MKILIFLFVLYVFKIRSEIDLDDPGSKAQIAALKDFYDSLNGDYWDWRYPEDTFGKVWNFDTDYVNPCEHWQGISCVENATTVQVQYLNLMERNLTGTIPDSISNLTTLYYIVLTGNSIGGTLSTEFCKIETLGLFALGNNNIHGTIPHCYFSDLPVLYYFAVYHNQLHGKLPELTEVVIPYLDFFAVFENLLTGTIPESIKYLYDTENVFLYGNFLSGPIDNLMALTHVTRLLISTNLFTGTIPNNISNLENLDYFALHENYFSQGIPDTFYELTKLVYVTTFLNDFTGSISENIGALTEMRRLSLDNNYFSGKIPDNLGSLIYLQGLDLYNNIFSGTVPASFSQMTLLTSLLIQRNTLTGPLQQAFNRSQQLNLQTVNIAWNRFTGSLPTDVFGDNLVLFAAYQLCLDGSIPDAICDAKSLQTLVLDGLTAKCAKRIWPFLENSPKVAPRVPGDIPHCIWRDLHNLTVLHVASNAIGGYIPDLDTFHRLVDVDISHNSLTGTIPKALQSKKDLKVLNLFKNKFSGTIKYTGGLPYSYNDDEDGIILKLSTNRLSGIIPLELEDAQHLNILAGNVFSCSLFHEPPESDPNSENYICGSNAMETAYKGFTSFCGTLTLVFIISWFLCWRLWLKPQSSVDANESNNVTDDDATPRLSILKLFYDLVEFVKCQFVRGFDEDSYNRLRSVLEASAQTLENTETFLQRFYHEITHTTLEILLWRARMVKFYSEYSSPSERSSFRATSVQRPDGLSPDLKDDIKISLPHQSDFERYKSLVQFLFSMKVLQSIILLTMVVQLIVNCISFSALKTEYRTFTNQYRWLPSGAFLAGYVPAIVLIVLWMISCSLVVTWIAYKIPKIKEFYGINHEVGSSITSRSSFSDRITLLLNNRSAHTNAIDDSGNTISNSRKTFEQSNRTTLSGKKRRGTRTIKWSFSTAPLSVWRAALLSFLVNCFMVVTIKATFIYLLLYYKASYEVKVLLSLLLSVCDIIWSAVIVPYAMNTVLPDRLGSASMMLLKVAVHYFNSIIAPCLAVAITENSCFRGVFIHEDTVTEQFDIEYCLAYSMEDNSCIDSLDYKVESDSTPTFVYNYSCYSSVVTEYVPIFMVAYTVLSVAVPIVSLLLTKCKKYYSIMALFPDIFCFPAKEGSEEQEITNVVDNPVLYTIKRVEGTSNDSIAIDRPSNVVTNEKKKPWKRDRLLFPSFILASMMHHILVMLTFGVMYPPLSIGIAFVTIVSTTTWEILIGRYLTLSEDGGMSTQGHNPTTNNPLTRRSTTAVCHEHSTRAALRRLDRLCREVCCGPRYCLGLLAYGSAVFIGLAAFDISGDEVGWQISIWTIAATLIYCPILLYVVSRKTENETSPQESETKEVIPDNNNSDSDAPNKESKDENKDDDEDDETSAFSDADVTSNSTFIQTFARTSLTFIRTSIVNGSSSTAKDNKSTIEMGAVIS